MEQNGEPTDKMSIYIKSRTKNGVPCDHDVAQVIVPHSYTLFFEILVIL